MPFKKGQSGNPRGRRKGSRNLVSTMNVREFWQRLVDDKRYWPNLRRRFNAGKAPHVEKYLLEMVYGTAAKQLLVGRLDPDGEARRELAAKRGKTLDRGEQMIYYHVLKKLRALTEEMDRRIAGQAPQRNVFATGSVVPTVAGSDLDRWWSVLLRGMNPAQLEAGLKAVTKALPVPMAAPMSPTPPRTLQSGRAPVRMDEEV